MSQYNEIISKVPSAFENGLKSGDLLFFPSTVTKYDESGVEYEIRLCKALQHKPTLPTPHFDSVADAGVAVQGTRGKVFDPFAPPHNPNLHVGDLQDEASQEQFAVLLNKYSVVQQHFLLVTKEFKSQASPLMPPELVQVYKLLFAAQRTGKRFFSFYNCGDNSGASQPHKHVQFIPVDEEGGPPIERLARDARLEHADRPFSLNKLSYANHVYRLPQGLQSLSLNQLEEALANAFLQLLDLSISTIRHDPDYPAGTPSYNVLMTLEHIHLIPRKHENYVMSETKENLSINSLGFAGMLLVKSEEELEAVKLEGVGNILRGVAVESVHSLQVEGTAQEAPLA